MRRARFAHALGVALCLAAVPLSGCATLPSAPIAPSALDRVTAAYQRVRAAAITAEPFLPTDIAAHVRESVALGDEALAAAQSQNGSNEQIQALSKLAVAIATIVTTVAKH